MLPSVWNDARLNSPKSLGVAASSNLSNKRTLQWKFCLHMIHTRRINNATNQQCEDTKHLLCLLKVCQLALYGWMPAHGLAWDKTCKKLQICNHPLHTTFIDWRYMNQRATYTPQNTICQTDTTVLNQEISQKRGLPFFTKPSTNINAQTHPRRILRDSL